MCNEGLVNSLSYESMSDDDTQPEVSPGKRRRVRMFILGASGSGKTSLVTSLVREEDHVTRGTRDSLRTTTWEPRGSQAMAEGTGMEDDDASSPCPVTFEMWDFPGRQVLQSILPLFYIRQAIYVLVFNLLNRNSPSLMTEMASIIHAKVTQSVVILVGTRADKLYTDEDRQRKGDAVLKSLLAQEHENTRRLKMELKRLSEMVSDPKILEQINILEGLLRHRPQIYSRVLYIGNSSGKGIDNLRSKLMSIALEKLDLPAAQTDNWLCDKIHMLRAAGAMIIPLAAFLGDLAREKHGNIFTEDNTGLTEQLRLLQNDGTIYIFHPYVASRKPYLCVHPAAVAHALCALHIDNANQRFQVRAQQFWPQETGWQKPEAEDIVVVLEDIPTYGVIWEVALPILWQDLDLAEDTLQALVAMLVELGWLESENLEGVFIAQTQALTMPNYLHLQTNRRYYAYALELRQNESPKLNWTPRPFNGDVQIAWRYDFEPNPPPGLLTQLLTTATRVAEETCSYKYAWREGALMRQGESIIFVEKATTRLDLHCRVNADEEGDEREALDYLWTNLAPFIRALEEQLKHWGGLRRNIFLVPMGDVLYHGAAVVDSHQFDLMTCFSTLKAGQDLYFTELGQERALDVRLLMPSAASRAHTLVAWCDQLLIRKDELWKKYHSSAIEVIELVTVDSPGNLIGTSTDTKSAKGDRKKLRVSWQLDDAGGAEISGDVKCTGTKMVEPEESETWRPVLPDDDVRQQMTDVASRFVSSVMATAVVDFLQAIHLDNHGLENGVTKAQVDAARLAADAATAAQGGDIDATARSVMAAAQSTREVDQEMEMRNRSRSCCIL